MNHQLKRNLFPCLQSVSSAAAFLALTALYQLTLNVDSQLGCTQYGRAQPVSSAHDQLLCGVSVQPYSVSTLVLQPGMRPEVLLLTLLMKLKCL